MMNQSKRVHICGIPVDAFTMHQTLEMIDQAIQQRRSIHHVVINAAKVVNAQRNDQLKKSIIECDIINADGKSIVWASRFLNCAVPERVAGIDLMENLVGLAHKRGYSIFFLGAKEDVINKVVQKYKLMYGDQLIAGYQNGYFQKNEERNVAERIAASGADILFVAITSPMKEIFLNTYKGVIKTPFIMGVGGSFDVVSGKIKRAPVWMQNSGFEWLYRVLQEPRRMWKRYLTTNIMFIFLVLRQKVNILMNSYRPSGNSANLSDRAL